MVEWHHRLSGHGFGWTPGVCDGQGGLVCCVVHGVAKSQTRLSDSDLTLHALRRRSIGGAPLFTVTALESHGDREPDAVQGLPHLLHVL